jgi:protein SCO1/2
MMYSIFRRARLLLVLMAFCLAGGAWAHKGEEPVNGGKVAQSPDEAILNQIGFEQKLNKQLPLGLEFTDESGKRVQLRQYFGEKPVVLLLIYYKCGMLCPLGVDMLLDSLKQVKASIGKEFNVVTVSINPEETPDIAADTKKGYIGKYGRPGAEKGWHFLTGKHEAIDELAKSIGFRYAYVKKTGEYAHPDGIVVATPEGKIARYFYRLEYPPRDVQFGLMEATRNRIGSPLTYLALSCFHYDPETGKYNFSVMKALRVFSVFFVTAVLMAVGISVWREKRVTRRDDDYLGGTPPAAAEA